jgi:hypothetical protein
MLRRTTWASLALVIACSDEPAAPPAPSRPNAMACACDAVEDCDACLRHIGECCYQDPTIEGRVLQIAAACAGDPACEVCCSECTRLPCDEMIARQTCPPVGPQ